MRAVDIVPLPVFLFTATALGCGGPSARLPDYPLANVNVGATAMELHVHPSGETRSLTSYRGKVVLVDVWATWCPPCRDYLPQLEALAGSYSRDDVAIVTVSLDEDEEALALFLEQTQLRLPVWRDPGGITVTRNLRFSEAPTSYILDTNGVVRFVHPGFGPGTLDEQRREIDSLLKEAEQKAAEVGDAKRGEIPAVAAAAADGPSLREMEAARDGGEALPASMRTSFRQPKTSDAVSQHAEYACEPGPVYGETELTLLVRRTAGLFGAVQAAAHRDRLPGHDGEAYFVARRTERHWDIVIRFPRGFVHPRYGAQSRYRRVSCERRQPSVGAWSCRVVPDEAACAGSAAELN